MTELEIANWNFNLQKYSYLILSVYVMWMQPAQTYLTEHQRLGVNFTSQIVAV